MSLEQSPLSRRDLLAWLGRAAAASWCLRCPGARTEDEDAGPPKLANLLALTEGHRETQGAFRSKAWR